MSNNLTKTGILGASNISVGRFTYGFEGISIRQWNEGAALRIGSFCSIASEITIFLGGNHRTDWITTFPFGYVYQDELGGEKKQGLPSTKGDVNIGSDVWIGHGVTILSGITVGDGAVLSANATVVKNVMPYEIVGGNPAKTLKKRFSDEIIDLLLRLKWLDLQLEDIKNIEKILCSSPDQSLLKKLIDRYHK